MLDQVHNANANMYMIQLQNDAKVISARHNLKYELASKKTEKTEAFERHAAVLEAIAVDTKHKLAASAHDAE